MTGLHLTSCTTAPDADRIETAAIALHASAARLSGTLSWEHTEFRLREVYRGHARAVLDAIARAEGATP